MQSAGDLILSARKTWGRRVGYFLRGSSGETVSFRLSSSVACGKANTEPFLKKRTLKLLPSEAEGSVPSGIPHALTVRLGMGTRHPPDGVGACSLPCPMSCCCLRGCHSYLPRVHAVCGVAECSPCLPQRNSWISENVPGLPPYGSTSFAWCILCTHQSLSYLCGGFVHLINFESWGFSGYFYCKS